MTIEPSTQHQTILGYGASSWTPDWITPAVRQDIIHEAVDGLGLTRLRVEAPGGNFSNDRRWEWENDNNDPYDINWSALNTARLDTRMTEFVLPFKQRVEANGDPFALYVSPSFFDGGSSGSVPPWLLHHPGEYAEFVTSILLHLKNAHGLVADYCTVLNEPGNNNPFSADVVGRMIRTLGPRLDSLGLSTRIQFPECVNANRSWEYIQFLQNDPGIWAYVSLLSYHLYGGNGDRQLIRNFGLARGLSTAQTEYMNLTKDHLYDDFTMGGVSVWEVYGLGSQFEIGYDSLQPKGQYWNFRQVLRYVRPGAVRIGASSDNTTLRVLAFNKASNITAVLINGSEPQQVNVSGLPAGIYSVSQNIGSGPYAELGLHTVDQTGILALNVPSNAVTTIHPHPGVNQPPVLTTWRVQPEYFIAPAGDATLSSSATDPELDTLQYLWSVKTQPPGATVSLATPAQPSTTASGLTITGNYVFTISVSDRPHTVSRDVRLSVFADNQPPVPNDVHNRNPVLLTLPQSSTQLRAGGWDLEKDPLTFLWEIEDQPPGAEASLETPDSASCNVSNMNVAGEYVFKVSVSDPTHTVSKTLNVPVYPANAAPEISAAWATPDELVLPADDTIQLSATTSDPDGDEIGHWWSVESSPAGATITFAQQSAPDTSVAGLTIPGTYKFKLSVVDRADVAAAPVTVSVLQIPGDFDTDGDVDQADFGHFQKCLTGPAIPVTAPECIAANFDGDGDVDQDDFALFEQCMTGANQPGDPYCMD